MSGKIPFAGPELLLYKLRTGGARWLMNRLRQELEMPRTKAGQALYKSARGLGRAFSPTRGSAGAFHSPDVLYAFYDLAVAPLTFDFLWHLVAAELERRKRGLTSIHLVIVPGKKDGVRQEDSDYDRVVDAKSRLARITNILVPACSFLPTISGITVASSRDEVQLQLDRFAPAHILPSGYEPVLPSYISSKGPLDAARSGETNIGVLRATEYDLDKVDRWLASRAPKRVVTITLREYQFMPARNSNLAAWSAFARTLDPETYSVVFVRDTDAAFEPAPPELAGLTTFPEAAFNLGLRMALYERAFVNLGVNNGPMGLCWLNERTCYLTFKMIAPNVPQTHPDYFGFLGFEVGHSLPFARPGQQFIWDTDSTDIIESRFTALLKQITQGV